MCVRHVTRHRTLSGAGRQSEMGGVCLFVGLSYMSVFYICLSVFYICLSVFYICLHVCILHLSVCLQVSGAADEAHVCL